VLAKGAILANNGQSAFEELTFRAFGAPIPGALLGVLPRVDPGAEARFFGALASSIDRRDLRDRFDDDWFANPRAHEALRHEHHLPLVKRPAPPPPPTAVASALRALADVW
jgi:hypothetical protein